MLIALYILYYVITYTSIYFFLQYLTPESPRDASFGLKGLQATQELRNM